MKKFNTALAEVQIQKLKTIPFLFTATLKKSLLTNSYFN